jgi:dienelactone hydrolase
MGETCEYKTPNGGNVSGYWPQPREHEICRGHPGVVGTQPSDLRVCDRFAAAGFNAMAPDLYHGG